MLPRTDTIPRTAPLGHVVAVDVTEDEYLARYAESRHEWVRGAIIKMSPVSLTHEQITAYLRRLLEAYLVFNPIGIVVGEPFVLRLAAAEAWREPDLQVILGDNRANLKDTYMDGPADICIEVVSPGSVAVDYGAKLEEYERAGVGEYWIVDPVRQAAHFHRLTGGVYRYFSAEADGCYRTPALPRFRLHVPTLWQTPLPDIVQTVELARAMLAEG